MILVLLPGRHRASRCCSGTLFSSEQQAAPVALLLGLGLAALGGSMAPLEVFPPTARTIAHVTPHAWANDAFSKLLDHGGDLVTVLPQVGVLLAFAAASHDDRRLAASPRSHDMIRGPAGTAGTRR